MRTLVTMTQPNDTYGVHRPVKRGYSEQSRTV